MPYGEEGTPVYTHLERTSQPMIRLASGDLTRWELTTNPCGRTYPRLPDGVYGRIDDMIQIRGENVYPTEIDNFLRGVDGYGGEHRIVVTRSGSMDEITVRAECSDGDQDGFVERAQEGLNNLTGLRVAVEAVDVETFERAEHKSRRVQDEREHMKR